MPENKKLKQELNTVKIMIEIYCKNKHKDNKETNNKLCNDCTELYTYAKKTLDRCKFGNNKPTCANCKIHCYKPDYREKIRQVMRFSGPRMIYTHPILAIKHLLKK